jgi:hypothetical protein
MATRAPDKTKVGSCRSSILCWQVKHIEGGKIICTKSYELSIRRKMTRPISHNYGLTKFGHTCYITKDHVEFCKHTSQPSGSPTLIPCRNLFRKMEKKVLSQERVHAIVWQNLNTQNHLSVSKDILNSCASSKMCESLTYHMYTNVFPTFFFIGWSASYLRNDFFLFVDGSIHPKKNDGETASLRVAHDAKFPSFFSDGYSIHKQNK